MFSIEHLKATMNPFIISPNLTGLVFVTGKDSFSFLQNIISNDIALLETEDIIHACLLTPQGKYLHDFYIRRVDGGYALACEGGARCDDLVQRLKNYKLRADVTIESKFVGTDNWVDEDDDEYKMWDADRIEKSLPDGSRDAEIGVSTLAELNLDERTVSYTKGCYIGQELVARMHNRNLGKKHLVGVEFLNSPPPFGTDIEGFGLMRSACGNKGLILMPRDVEEQLKQGKIAHAPFRLLGL